MNWPLLIGGGLTFLTLAALLYWQLNLAEGVYLGPRVVVWLYDRFAPRYDSVKRFNEQDEAWFLGKPLAQALHGVTTSLVLDVATGTARLPMALFRQPTFTGRVIGLDLSRQMLRQAAVKTAAYRDRLTLLWQDAVKLPFVDAAVDVVSCLEALEFLPEARTTLVEMVRVLRPGGILLISNRIGPGARWMPGRTMSRQDLTALLESLAVTNVQIAAWQVDYDIVWARKPLPMPDSDPAWPSASLRYTLPNVLRCPRCGSTPLTRGESALCCDVCHNRYPIADDGVVEMGF